jgi:isoleucyl-tRNA synthetase
MNFNEIEQDIITYWKNYQLKNKLIESRKTCPKWEFLDGPPFVNGSPHYGHLLVSFIKDTIGRYMSQKGYSISYQIGFDCHGLPLEQEAEKQVGKISPTDTNEKLTIFNDECRRIISSCSDIWYDTLERLGRQFDKSQTYYTSDFKFMESIWWAFKKLWNQNLIYRSKKVMPYSPKCETPLSNFEATSNYQDRTDIAVYVKFKRVNMDEYFLIWTTTPWSLFANQGICINATFDYNLICLNNEKLWICSDFVSTFLNYTIIKTVKGSDLIGLSYEPIFTLDNYNNYIVYADNYVTNKSGTGLVHLAPMYGVDDMRVMKASGYVDSQLPEYLINSECKFTNDYDILKIKDRFVIDTSTDIVIYLKTHGHAIKSEKIKHSYPHCWRTDYPLIYLATDAWFMNVQEIIPELIENNKKIRWVPEHVGTERFANWIKDSPDWCLSRNRVWGTPIPIWENEHGDTICIGSASELELYTGKKFTDLHLDKIGDVEFTTKDGTYKRTFGVADCWLESGMAGLARFGFPQCDKVSYPVDFIAESVDQTRGWFYTLNVLSTALNHSPAFKQVIVSGLILAADGKKMSKRLGNYTSPDHIIETYGVDILRLYLIGSPASKAESFCFKDSDLIDIKHKLLPYYNAHVMLSECIAYIKTMFDFKLDLRLVSTNKLDMWINFKYIEFSQNIYKHMEKLEITYIPNLIYKFIENICNVFIKLSRDRMKCQLTELDCKESLSTLHSILSKCNILLAPFLPHLVEYYNKILFIDVDNEYESIHMQKIDIDYIKQTKINDKLLKGFYSVNELLESVRNLRQQINKPIYYPINFIELYTDSEIISEYSDIICKELNIKKITVFSTSKLQRLYKANKGQIGKIYKKDSVLYANKIESGDISWDGCNQDLYTFTYIIDKKENMIGAKFDYLDYNDQRLQAIVYIDTTSTKENDIDAEINNIRRQVNAHKKNMGIKMFHKVEIIFEKNDYFSKLSCETLTLLTQRLISPIKFENKLTDYNVITTFNGKILHVLIKLVE